MLKDDSIIPFGKYNATGTKMANVPAEYLAWLYTQLKPTAPNRRTLAQKDVLEYIEENMDVINKELSEKHKLINRQKNDN